jgi:hypothetical protein
MFPMRQHRSVLIQHMEDSELLQLSTTNFPGWEEGGGYCSLETSLRQTETNVTQWSSVQQTLRPCWLAINTDHTVVRGVRDFKTKSGHVHNKIHCQPDSCHIKWRSFCVSTAQETQDAALRTVSNRTSDEYISFIHGADPFLRNFQLCCYSRTSQHFMAPGGSLPHSQDSSTGPHPEPDQSNPYHPILSL